jgi:anaerobic selenocysteine-containing dehydrogenase
MADYKEYLEKLNRQVYHDGEWQWQEGDFTVTRTHHWSPPGCHDSCGLLLYTKDGILQKVEGDPLNPYNNGRLCMRCIALPEAVNSPDRLKWPLKRAGEKGENKWERISWEEAYDIIEEKVNYIKKEYGPETIIGIHGTGRNINWQTPYFFHAAFETSNVVLLGFSGSSCYLPRVVGCAAALGDFWIADYSQTSPQRYENPEWKVPECVVIWGNDPIKSNGDGLFGHWIVECMQLGTKLIVIDPRLTWLGAKAEYWLPIRPATDGALALGMMRVIVEEDLYDHEFVEKWCDGFDRLQERLKEWPVEKAADICQIPASLIRDAARFYAKSKPAAIQWGLALDQQYMSLTTNTAIVTLSALTGNIDVPGGNIIVRNAFNTDRMYDMGTEWVSEEVQAKMLQTGAYGHAVGCMPPESAPDEIIRAMETGKPYPVKMLWFQSNNSIACGHMESMRGYEAIKNVEFVVVADPFMTPTAVAYADIVLPISMSCERNSIRTWWQPLRSIVKVSQYYECKSDEEVIVELGRRLNPKAFPFNNDIEFLEWYLKEQGSYTGTFEELRKKGWIYWDFDTIYHKHEIGLLRPDGEPGFNTPSGKIEMAPSMYEFGFGFDPVPHWYEPPYSPVSDPELAKEYPYFCLTGGRSYEFFHSEHRNLETMREFHPWPLVQINPETAAKHEIEDGDWVFIENWRGRFMQKAKITPIVPPNMVHVEHGWWYPEQEAAEPRLYGVLDSQANNITPVEEVGEGGVGCPVKSQLCKIYKRIEGVNDQVLPTEQMTTKQRGGK